METKKIEILQDNINFQLTSCLDDDTYDVDVIFDKNIIMTFHITNEGKYEIYFGFLSEYYISVNTMNEIIRITTQRLQKEQQEWLTSISNKK